MQGVNSLAEQHRSMERNDRMNSCYLCLLLRSYRELTNVQQDMYTTSTKLWILNNN